MQVVNISNDSRASVAVMAWFVDLERHVQRMEMAADIISDVQGGCACVCVSVLACQTGIGCVNNLYVCAVSWVHMLLETLF